MLVSAIRSGDEGAMAQLYERYSPIVYAVAVRVLGDTGAAEDILQEVFMQIAASFLRNHHIAKDLPATVGLAPPRR